MVSVGASKRTHSPINLRPVYGDLNAFLKNRWSPYKAEDEAAKLVEIKVGKHIEIELNCNK